MKQSLVSLIIPVYNGKENLHQCLDSIFSQTYLPLEVIFVDDGSIDGSAEYLQQEISCRIGDLQAKDVSLLSDEEHTKVLSEVENTRLRSWEKIDDSIIKLNDGENGLCFIIKQQENAGVAVARNTGIALAGGKYLMFADQDDGFLATYIADYVLAIETSHADIVVGGYSRVRTDGTIMMQMILTDAPFGKYVVTAPWAHIYQASYIRKHHISFLSTAIGEDIYFNLIAFAKGGTIHTINNCGYQWMFNESSVSNSKQNQMKETVDPLFLLQHIYDDMGSCSFRKHILTEYFMLRYACWYMLFSSRGSKKSDITKMHAHLQDWLKAHYPSYLKNPYIRRMPPGEDAKTHRFVRIFYRLHKMGALLPLLKMFGR